AALLALLRKDTVARPVHPRDIRVQVESDAQLIGDEPEIHSAFSNLVDNAAKYTPAEGSLEMRWWVDDDGGHFAVSDTGMGLPARAHSGLAPSSNYCVSLDIIHNSIIRKKYLAPVSRERNTARGPWRRSVAKQELQGRMAGSKPTRAGRTSARTLFLSNVHLG